MRNSGILAFCGITAFFLITACTQPPAEIVYKGNEAFTREHKGTLDSPDHETYASDSSRYKQEYVEPAEPASVPAVAVNDLPPPKAVTSTKLQDISPAAGKAHTLDEKHEVQQVASLDDKPQSALHKEESKPAMSSGKSSKFIWPVDGGKVISHFNASKKGNDGINIAMAEGEPIYASADGSVVYAGNELEGYGNMVILKHKDGFMTAYAHAHKLAVHKGESVKQGDLIAYVGSTGKVKKPQLHFALRKGKTPVNPEDYLPKNG